MSYELVSTNADFSLAAVVPWVPSSCIGITQPMTSLRHECSLRAWLGCPCMLSVQAGAIDDKSGQRALLHPLLNWW